MELSEKARKEITVLEGKIADANLELKRILPEMSKANQLYYKALVKEKKSAGKSALEV